MNNSIIRNGTWKDYRSHCRQNPENRKKKKHNVLSNAMNVKVSLPSLFGPITHSIKVFWTHQSHAPNIYGGQASTPCYHTPPTTRRRGLCTGCLRWYLEKKKNVKGGLLMAFDGGTHHPRSPPLAPFQVAPHHVHPASRIHHITSLHTQGQHGREVAVQLLHVEASNPGAG